MTKVDITKNPAYKALFESVSSNKVWEDVKSAGGNPNELFAKYAPNAFRVYPVDTNGVRSKFVIGRFAEAIQVLNNRDNTGLIIGTYDTIPRDGNFSGKKPESAALLKGDGSLVNVSIFNHDIYTMPGIYNMKMTFNDKRNNYIANSLLEYRPIVKNPIPALCSKAHGVDFDWYSYETNTYPTVIIKGRLSYVQAHPKFDGGAITGEEELYMPNHRLNPVMVPVLCAILDRENTDNRVTVMFSPTNNGIPFIGDASINGMLMNMNESGLTKSQIIPAINSMVRGNEYVIVGTLTKVGTFNDKEGNSVNDIRIRAMCMLNVNENPFAEFVSTDTNSADIEALAEKVSSKKSVSAPSQSATTSQPKSKKSVDVEDDETVEVETEDVESDDAEDEYVEEEEVVIEQPPKRIVKKPSAKKAVQTEESADFF